MARMLDTESAARRLGVKRETLYAYVSRGLVTSHRSTDGRSSMFDLDEIERLAARSRGAREVETRLQTVTTAITEVTVDGPRYRGRAAVELAASARFEEVAELLWGVPAGTWSPPVPLVLPPVGTDRDRIRVAVVLAGAGDPLRADRRPDAVGRAASRLIASVVTALPSSAATTPQATGARGDPGGVTGGTTGGIARDLARRVGAPETSVALERALGAALVLLADHELAVSSLAVRIAASTRASLYDALLAGLACNGPLHVGASEPAYGLLVEAGARGAPAALDEALRFGGTLPGFGHAIYTGTDPRFDALVPHVAALSPAVASTLEELVGVAGAHGLPGPNVDLGLAALTLGAGARRDAGVTVFTVARFAGWVAHYLEELGERPLRFRARALFTPRREA